MKEAEEYDERRVSVERMDVALYSDVMFRFSTVELESIVSVNVRLHGMKEDPLNVRITVESFSEVESVTESSIGMKKGDV